MVLSYTEELVSEYFKHIMDEERKPKYLVSEHVHYQTKGPTGWHDIDVLAISEDEVCIIQTKSYAIFENTVKESIEESVRLFKEQEQFVKKRYNVTGKTIKKIFIADVGLSKTFTESEDFKKAGIITEKLVVIVRKYLQILQNLYPDKYHVGKEENNVTRTLIFLLYTFPKEVQPILSSQS